MNQAPAFPQARTQGGLLPFEAHWAFFAHGAPAANRALRAAAAALRLEHHEISRSGTLEAWAEKLGMRQVTKLLDATRRAAHSHREERLNLRAAGAPTPKAPTGPAQRRRSGRHCKTDERRHGACLRSAIRHLLKSGQRGEALGAAARTATRRAGGNPPALRRFLRPGALACSLSRRGPPLQPSRPASARCRSLR